LEAGERGILIAGLRLNTLNRRYETPS
jgi:hypothetical protein